MCAMIKTPHLPRGRVGFIMIGERYREKLEMPLVSRGTEVLWLPDDPLVDPRLAAHADLQAIHLGGERLVLRPTARNIVNILTNRGFQVIAPDNEQSAVYPGDCGLNACIVVDKLIHNIKRTDPAVLRTLPDAELVNVSQGYAKCSVCVMDEHSIITSDAGIAKAAALHGIETLLIRQGFIELPGFDEGFIGGSSFKLSRHELAFTGSLEGHPDRDSILSFVAAREVRPVYLTDGPVFDIGSAIPLLER